MGGREASEKSLGKENKENLILKFLALLILFTVTVEEGYLLLCFSSSVVIEKGEPASDRTMSSGGLRGKERFPLGCSQKHCKRGRAEGEQPLCKERGAPSGQGGGPIDVLMDPPGPDPLQMRARGSPATCPAASLWQLQEHISSFSHSG